MQSLPKAAELWVSECKSWRCVWLCYAILIVCMHVWLGGSRLACSRTNALLYTLETVPYIHLHTYPALFACQPPSCCVRLISFAMPRQIRHDFIQQPTGLPLARVIISEALEAHTDLLSIRPVNSHQSFPSFPVLLRLRYPATNLKYLCMI